MEAKLVTTLDALRDVREKLWNAKAFSVDVETSGVNKFKDVLEGVSLSTDTHCWFISMAESGQGSEVTATDLHDALDTVFDDETKIVLGHNIVFDLHFLDRFCHLVPRGEMWDTMTMAHLLYEVKMNHLGLKTLAPIFTDITPKDFKEGYLNKPLEEQAEYAMGDAIVTYKLAKEFGRRLSARKLLAYYREHVAPLSRVVFKMEKLGWRLDRAAVLEDEMKLMMQLQAIQDDIRQNFEAWTGKEFVSTEWSSKKGPAEFNINSSQQIGKVLTHMGEKLPPTPGGGASSGAKVLEKLTNNPLAQAILRYRGVNKLMSTYIRSSKGDDEGGLLGYSERDGRIHANQNICGTVTGRFSSSKPNMQNNPRPGTTSQWGVNPRRWFIASEGHKLVVADMGQAEVKVLALLSGDKDLIAAVNSGEDIHSEFATACFGERFTCLDKDCEDRKELRLIAKTVVFGIMYGRGANSIAENLGLTVQEAQEVIDSFFRRFPGVANYINKIAQQLNTNGEVRTLKGRPRRPVFATFPPPDEADRAMWNFAYVDEMKRAGIEEDESGDDYRNVNARRGRALRQGINSTIQGTVAELVNDALIELTEKGWDIVGQVHDEIILDVPEDRVEEAERDLTEVLSREYGGVKFTATAAHGDSWADAK